MLQRIAPTFAQALRRAGSPQDDPRAAAAPPNPRTWVYVHEDQLSDRLGPLARLAPRHAGVILIERAADARQRPFHRQRLALIWANQRHFALEQAARGVRVAYVIADEPLPAALRRAAAALAPPNAAPPPITLMQPAEYQARTLLAPLVRAGLITIVPHDGWLTTTAQFNDAQPGPFKKPGSAWRMDVFYRAVRRASGLLMDGDEFRGGKLSFDADNRQPWRGTPPPANPPRFEPDAVTAEVIARVERDFADHPGTLDSAALPATLDDAQRLWAWALRDCLPHFGPYEDAMSTVSRTLFHTRLSALINLHRLLPRDVVEQAARANIPLQGQEGFIRQILGWREFVRHVHEATDGFRRLPPPAPRAPAVPTGLAPDPGDAGFHRWARRPWPAARNTPDPSTGPDPVPDGGATPAALGDATPLPPAYWGAPSGLACLDNVVASVWAEAYSHHITRLMVLSNLATLLDVSPRQLTDWFWIAYADAWDWVVEPNVLAMGTYAVGGLMTTKPYIAGSAYIDKMSDYCARCAFVPGESCPITPLYWAFLDRHRHALEANPRLMMPMRALAKRDPDRRARDQHTFVLVRDLLIKGQPLTPDALATVDRPRSGPGPGSPSTSTAKPRPRPRPNPPARKREAR